MLGRVEVQYRLVQGVRGSTTLTLRGDLPVPRVPPSVNPFAQTSFSDIFAKGLPDHQSSLVALIIWRNVSAIAFPLYLTLYRSKHCGKS